MMAARTLDIRHTINGNVVTIKEVTDVDNEVRVTEKCMQYSFTFCCTYRSSMLKHNHREPDPTRYQDLARSTKLLFQPFSFLQPPPLWDREVVYPKP